MHSVQRPPYSIGLFTLAEMKAILAWILDTYYRHYKLYMYAFTDRVLMSLTQAHPLDIVEAAPPLPPLNDAMTEEQHDALMSEEQRKVGLSPSRGVTASLFIHCSNVPLLDSDHLCRWTRSGPPPRLPLLPLPRRSAWNGCGRSTLLPSPMLCKSKSQLLLPRRLSC